MIVVLFIFFIQLDLECTIVSNVFYGGRERYSHVAKYVLVHRVEWGNWVFSCLSHGSVSTIYIKCGLNVV